MTYGKKLFSVLLIMALTACSTPAIKQDSPAQPVNEDLLESPSPSFRFNPPLTLLKDNIKLNLVRVMDGGACKNELQGVKGTFLLYANPEDVERIKNVKGAKIFNEFENKIQTFSTDALQQAINEANLAEDPFALDEDEARQKLTKQLAKQFDIAIREPIMAFEKETTLTIAITIFSPSFVFYQKGCDAIQTDENTEVN
jgi:hypothetical protein